MHQRLVNFVGSDGLRYLAAGSSAFIIEYSAFYILYRVEHWQVYIANSTSFCIGLIVSFTLNRNWAFKKESFRRAHHHQMVMYIFLAAFNLFMTNVIIGSLQYVGLDPRLGKIVSMSIIICWNFLIFRKIIFAAAADEES